MTASQPHTTSAAFPVGSSEAYLCDDLLCALEILLENLEACVDHYEAAVAHADKIATKARRYRLQAKIGGSR